MMKIILWISIFTLTILTKASSLDNLSICLDGKYSILCKYELLTESQKREAKKAERRENLKICLDGKYSVLCKRELLTNDQKN